jgi:hypothetical protein
MAPSNLPGEVVKDVGFLDKEDVNALFKCSREGNILARCIAVNIKLEKSERSPVAH